MYKKLYILILFFSLIIVFVGCGKIISFAKISNDKPSITIVPNSNETNKLQIGFNDYYAYYNGYIDQVAMFDNEYDNQDYDGDGLKDRIYRRVFDVVEDGKVIGRPTNYRIDFGNGDILEIGDFEDYFTGIQVIGYDLTRDGINEIIICGKHEASTFPPIGSEIAVYQEKDNEYEMIPLPRRDDWVETEKFIVGYSFYKKDINKNEVTIYSPKLNYEETIVIKDNEALEFIKQANYKDSIADPAWKVKVTEHNGVPTLVLYMHIGFKYYDKDYAVYLAWENGELKPVDIKIEPTRDNSIDE